MNKMKFMLYALIAMFATTISACSNDDNNWEDLPTNVQNAFVNKYPDTRVDEWKKKGAFYIIEFRLSGDEAEAWFEGDVWKMTEKDASFNNLPQTVINAFKTSDYADWRIDDVDIVERYLLPTLYVIEVEKGNMEVELSYLEDGTFVKEIIDSDDDGYLPQIPNKIGEMVKEMYPGAIILDVEMEKGLYEVEIWHEGTKKEIMFDANFEWMYTKWDVSTRSLPQAVMSYIQNTYPGYKIDDAEMVTTPKTTYYEIELEKGNTEIELRITPDGEII